MATRRKSSRRRAWLGDLRLVPQPRRRGKLKAKGCYRFMEYADKLAADGDWRAAKRAVDLFVRCVYGEREKPVPHREKWLEQWDLERLLEEHKNR